MSQQEINLYRVFIKPPAPPSLLTWERFLMIMGGLFVIFVIMAIYDYWNLRTLQNIKAYKTNEIAQLQKIFVTEKKKYPAFFFSNDVDKSIKQLEYEIETQKKVLASAANHTPFSQDLIAFSRNITPDTWLTKITLTNGSEKITVTGHSLSFDSLKKFYNNLSNEKLFDMYNLTMNEYTNGDKKEDTTTSVTPTPPVANTPSPAASESNTTPADTEANASPAVTTPIINETPGGKLNFEIGLQTK